MQIFSEKMLHPLHTHWIFVQKNKGEEKKDSKYLG